MSKIKEAALQFAKLQLSVLPATENKIPTLKEWKPFQQRIMDEEEINKYFSSAKAVALAIICGRISDDLEIIDIDTKYDLSGNLYKDYVDLIKKADPDLFYLLVKQQTKSGGSHFIYRCPVIGKNQKLASRPATDEEKKSNEKEKVLIETRGEGGYFISAPSEGYVMPIECSYDKINLITPLQRDILFNCARSLNQLHKENAPSSEAKQNTEWLTSPGDDFDATGNILDILVQHGWKIVSKKGQAVYLKRPGDSTSLHSASFNKIPNRFWCWSTSTEFNPETLYKPYAVFAMLECKGDYKQAAARLIEMGYGKKAKDSGKAQKQEEAAKAQDTDSPYIRVGTTYFKRISISDARGNEIIKIIKWNKEEIVLDMGKKFLYTIPKYDSFIVRPSHTDYKQSIGSHYNIYSRLTHEIYSGEFDKTKYFLKHIFGAKYDLFLDYMTILWRYPTQILPIIALVSEKRQTGKTTVLNYLRAIFQANAVILKNENFQTSFNSHYAGKLLIMIDENYVELDKKKESERIKSMATADVEFLQFKGKDSEEVDFYGKIFMTANNKEFIKIDKEEIRYMVVEVPSFEKNQPDLLYELVEEIPCFLYFLNERKIVHKREDRAWFKPDLLGSETLTEVVNNTKNKVETLIEDHLKECFEIFGDELYMTASDLYTELKDDYRFLDKVIVRKYLKNSGYELCKLQRYSYLSLKHYASYDPDLPFPEKNYEHKKIGTPFKVNKL